MPFATEQFRRAGNPTATVSAEKPENTKLALVAWSMRLHLRAGSPTAYYRILRLEDLVPSRCGVTT